ncbi:MAG: cytochrome o ubiquinol oxidase subunit [Candidatus Kaiserbacteria bacterium]|nr:cytochrome o ubiquinol oxidase subunit [Candidatus Kaiserbacteria bacterium]
MSTNNYFEEIGAWPFRTHSLGGMYGWGYVLSLLLTIASYEAVMHHIARYSVLIVLVLVLACVQFAVQLVCFLHLGRETVSRERFIVLSCTALIVIILLSGSLWIMFALNERMVPSSDEMTQYMKSQQGI